MAGSRMKVRLLWHRVHRWPRWRRWPLKGGFLALIVVLTLFPKVWLLPVWIQRLADLNAVVDPNCPDLAELQARVAARVGERATLPRLMRGVENVVYERIPYAYDWDTWGVMDYLPTAAEVFAMGREDCDGRAVVAASLLRRLGYDAWLTTDMTHTWVVACDRSAAQPVECELMAPGAGEKTLTGGAAGTRLKVTWATLRNLVNASAFGVAVFPVGRELVILVALVITALQPRSSWGRRIIGCGAVATALFLWRTAGSPPHTQAVTLLLWIAAMATLLGGWLLLVVKGAGRRSPAERSG
jgi:hypothetical protein